jgi:AcrR family transcriptional regulator
MAATVQSGLRLPQQRRSRESLERVLKASEKLLAQKGYEGFTIAEVSRSSGVSVGSVYGRFENKDALIHAVHARQIERLERMIPEMEAIGQDTDADLESALTRAVDALAGVVRRERALLRVFMMRGPVDPTIRELASRSSRRAAHAFEQAILARRDEIAHPRPEVAVDLVFRAIYDVLSRRVMYGPTFESGMKHSWDRLVGELITAGLAYLRFGDR